MDEVTPSGATKICAKCGIEKPVEEFQRRTDTRNGRQSRCKPCRKEYAAERYLANREHLLNLNHEWIDRVKREEPERMLVQSARQRAKRRGIPFTITMKDIVIPERCPVLGIPLERGTRTHHAASPSIDEVVPGLGYIPGNVQVISHKANAMKRDANPEELQRFARYYYNAAGGD